MATLGGSDSKSAESSYPVLKICNIFLLLQAPSPMKKFANLKQAGGETGKLVVFTQANFQGEQHSFADSVAKINECPWKGKSIGSVIIQGNPWLFYPEELMKVPMN